MIILAIIRPFKALKYNKKTYDNISDLVCPPYDIIDKSKTQVYINKSPYNAIRLELPKSNGAGESVKSIFSSWKKNKVLVKDDKESLYVYEMEFKINNQAKKLRGIICLVKIEELKNGNIIAHEKTFNSAKQERLVLLKNINCNTSPIYALFNGDNETFNKNINSVTKEKESAECIDSENVIHRIWQIRDKRIIDSFSRFFKGKKLFIADGHHRYETAINYKKYCRETYNKSANYTMMFLADIRDKNLIMLPTHRLVKLKENFNIRDFKIFLSEHFEIEERLDIYNIENVLEKVSLKNKCLGFYYKNKTWLLLTLKKREPTKSSYCETQILNELILAKIFKSPDLNILAYTRDLGNAFNLINRGDFQGAFIMPKIHKDSLINIFEKRIRLPQKTTYFYPKPITGLVMNEIEFSL